MAADGLPEFPPLTNHTFPTTGLFRNKMPNNAIFWFIPLFQIFALSEAKRVIPTLMVFIFRIVAALYERRPL
jgi:hypothetical protein